MKPDEQNENEEITIDNLHFLGGDLPETTTHSTIEQGPFDEPTLLDREGDAEDETEEDAISAKDLAFLKSQAGAAKTLPFGGKDGRGIELYPFNTIRKVGAESMGLKAFSLSEELNEIFSESGQYPGILKDAIYVCFLCSSSENISEKAWNNPRTVSKLAMRWAEKYRIEPGTKNHAAVLEAWGSMYFEIILNFAEIHTTQTDGGGEGDETGQPLGES